MRIGYMFKGSLVYTVRSWPAMAHSKTQVRRKEKTEKLKREEERKERVRKTKKGGNDKEEG